MTGGRIAVTVREAAGLCGLSVSTLERAYAEGQFPVSRVGRRVLIRPADLDRWITSKQASVRSKKQGTGS